MNTTPATRAASQRLLSLDALRGFDMFWIVGADSLAHSLERYNQSPLVLFVAQQLRHVPWEGLHFYDLIFPLFIFLVGASIPFSLARKLGEEGRTAALKRILVRTLLLYAAGIVYEGALTRAWPDVRLVGVLGRIALAYGATAMLYCYLKPRALLAVCAGLLAGYWAMLEFVPIRNIQLEKTALVAAAERSGDAETAALLRQPGNWSRQKDSPALAAAHELYERTTERVTGRYDNGLNLASHIDFERLPGRKHEIFWDNCGLLSTLPAIATCLLGVFAGLVLIRPRGSPLATAVALTAAGSAAAALGWLWSLEMPVIKMIWTSSYTLVTAGYSAILLGVSYLLIDVWQKRSWCRPFVWLGTNALAIYLAVELFDGFVPVAKRLAGGDVHAFLERHAGPGAGDLVITLIAMLLVFWLAQALHARRIFIRL